VLKRKGIVAMNGFQIILVLVFFVAFILIFFAKKRFPEKVNKLIPYNFVVLGSLFCYLSKGNNNVNKFCLLAGVGFFVYGIFLLFKRSQLHKEDRA
jgi:phosphoglycerol transferase MdoB-like AlkP superfamily enzyme